MSATSPHKWWILIAMGFTLGVVVLDETIVGVALPSMQKELGMSTLAGHWVVNAYLIVLTGLAAVGGKATDIFGHKRPFLTGITLFGLGSLACGFAPDANILISARVLQGLGAAIIFPSTIAMVSMAFPAEQRGMALGIYTTFGGVFMTLGPLLGGIFSQELSWRWIFWVNLPVVLCIIVVFLLTWREPHDRPTASFTDRAGPLTFVLGLVLVTLAVMQGADWGWASLCVLGAFILGALSIASFIWLELKRKDPLFDLQLFRLSPVCAGNTIIFMGQFNKVGIVIYLAAFLQHNLGMDPISAGLGLLPGMAILPFSSYLAGWVADRLGSRGPMLSGFALSIAGVCAIGLAAPMNNYWLLLPSILIFGLTLPFHYVPTRRGVMNAVPAKVQGEASGLTMTTQLLGGTLGLAIGSAVLAATGSFAMIFFTMTGLSILVWITAWRLTQRPPGQARTIAD